MEEIWKNIKEYEGLYQVSNLGRVKSLERIIYLNNGKKRLQKEIIMKQQLNKGYFYVKLTKNKKTKNFSVHRLVAIHFIPNIDNKELVNHKDGCKTNNCETNLEWVDKTENYYHALRLGLFDKEINQKINSIKKRKKMLYLKIMNRKKYKFCIKEIWKIINENNNYKVSNLGRVKNIKTGRILKQQVSKKGYLCVGLSKNGKIKKYPVHRLVAKAFILNPNNFHQVNHIDCNKKK